MGLAMAVKPQTLAEPEIGIKGGRINGPGPLRTSVAIRLAASTTTSSSRLPSLICMVLFKVSGPAKRSMGVAYVIRRESRGDMTHL